MIATIYLWIKYYQTSPKIIRLQNVCDITIPFSIDENGLPMITIDIGTPPQPINVVLDTGSSNLVVSGAECTTCKNLRHYNPTKSTSSNKIGKCTIMSYGTQEDQGCWFTDVVRFHGSCSSNEQSNFEVLRNLMFVVSHERKNPPHNKGNQTSHYCILGLAPQKENSVIQQLLGNNVFSIISTHHGQWFLFGRSKQFHFDTIAKLTPVVYPNMYAAKIQRVKWSSGYNLFGTIIIMDTGSNMLYIPRTIWERQKSHSVSLELTKDVTIQISKKNIFPYETHENNVFIFGCLLLKNVVFEFNPNSHSVTLSFSKQVGLDDR